MSPLVQQLIPCVEALRKEERAALADYLLKSLEPDEVIGTDADFDALLIRRIEDVRSGRVEGISAEELYSRIGET
jgi:putative addiction module component (TIGR02574 family)